MPVSAANVILGMLSLAPMSGYDVVQAVDQSVGRLWPVSKTQVYAELSRLEKGRLVKGRKVAQRKLPDKRVFELTQAGERTLDAWLASDPLADEAPQFRLPFAVRAFFGHRMSPEHARALFEAVAASAAEELSAYHHLDELVATVPGAVHARSAVRLGVHLSAAVEAWAKECATDVAGLRVHIDPNRHQAPTARRLLDALAGTPSEDDLGQDSA